MIIYITLLVKEWRNIRGISQNKLAKEINMSQSYLSRLESNKKSPSLKMMLKIAVTLEVKLCQLYTCEEEACQCKNKILPEVEKG